MTAGDLAPLAGTELTEAISAAMVDLYGRFYGHDQIADGGSGDVIDGRVAFQVAGAQRQRADRRRVDEDRQEQGP